MKQILITILTIIDATIEIILVVLILITFIPYWIIYNLIEEIKWRLR